MSKYLYFTWLCLAVSGCQTMPVPAASPTMPPARFLLTYDDGPSASRGYNPTLDILRQLESNDVQPHIKALFFVQTRNKAGGGDDYGQAVLRYQHEAGHVLGLHSGTERGHIRHTKMSPEELGQSLQNGRQDLRAITGSDPHFIRPTFWGFSDQTRDLYAAHDLKMLLTDVNSRDGIRLHNLFGFRQRIRSELWRTRHAIERGALPQHLGHIPVVVTFHDLNNLTASNMTAYLRVLVEEASIVGLPLADKPFYDNRDEIVEAVALRAVPPNPVPAATQKSAGNSIDQPVAVSRESVTVQVTDQARSMPVTFNPVHPASTLR